MWFVRVASDSTPAPVSSADGASGRSGAPQPRHAIRAAIVALDPRGLPIGNPGTQRARSLGLAGDSGSPRGESPNAVLCELDSRTESFTSHRSGSSWLGRKVSGSSGAASRSLSRREETLQRLEAVGRVPSDEAQSETGVLGREARTYLGLEP